MEDGKRYERDQAPEEGKLAVVMVPEATKENWAGGDGEENADERQRPWPLECCAVERWCRVRALGRAGGQQRE